MDLIKRPSMSVAEVFDDSDDSIASDDRSDEYHLCFVNSDASARYGRKMDAYLDEIFSNANGNPIKYKQHKPSHRNGTLRVLVRFGLSKYGINRGLTLEEAAIELCRQMFDPINRTWLIMITTDSFLGITAACESWSRYIRRAFFMGGFQEGPAVLDAMVRTNNTADLPQWAVVFAFAVVSGMSLSIFLNGSNSERALEELMGVAGVGRAAQLLERFVDLRPDRAEVEMNWQRNYGQFEMEMQRLPTALESYINSRGINSASELGDALWYMTLAASRVATTNLETLAAFKIYKTINENEMAVQAAGMGLSAFAGVLTFEEVAVATGTMVVCANPAVALTAGAVAFFCGVKFFRKNKERKANKKRVNYHAKLRPIIVHASYLTYYTDRFLQWVHVTDRAQPRAIDFVDNDARENWRDFITEVRQRLKQPVTNKHLRAAYVQEFLRQQVGSLRDMWDDLLAENDKVFGAHPRRAAIGM